MSKLSLFLTLIFGFPSYLLGTSGQLSIPEGLIAYSGMDTVFVAKCALFLAVVLLWTILFGQALKKLFHVPVIAGQILAGIALGPSLLDIKGWGIFSLPLQFFDAASGTVYSLASSDLFIFFIVLISSVLTVSYLLWIAGHETDIKDILKVGLTALAAGIFGAIVPIIMTVFGAYYILDGSFTFARSIAIGLIFSATSVSIPVAMLFARNKMYLKSSKATLGAAIIDDIVAVVLLSIFFICAQSGYLGHVQGLVNTHHTNNFVEAVAYMIASFAVIFSTGYFIIPPVVRWLKDNQYDHLVASVAKGTMLMYFCFAELVGGLAGITGAYFAGLFHRMGDSRHQAEKVISPFVNTFLLPLFLGSIGLQVDVSILNSQQWVIVCFFLVLAIISKLIGCYAAIFLSNISHRKSKNNWTMLEGYLFGSSMVARGEVGLVVATILRASGILTFDQYVIAVVVIVLTTVAAPIMLGIGFWALDNWAKQQAEHTDCTIGIGQFGTVGTRQMFNIIAGHIEGVWRFKTAVQFSEGRRIINVQDHNVKIIYSPRQGIVFKGNREHIQELIKMVKSAIAHDVEGLSHPIEVQE